MNRARLKSIGYWLATGILALQFLVGGVFSLLRPPVVVAGMQHLGYPSYFALILGTWKVLGVLALLAPRFARLKEWAYAGIVFDLTGAAFSHLASGDGSEALSPLLFLVLTVASYALRPSSRTIGSQPSTGSHEVSLVQAAPAE